MWDTVLPKTNCSWEPVELRILKQELASMACKCNTCESYRNPLEHYRVHAQCNDEAVQVNQNNNLLNKYIYADSDMLTDTDQLQSNTIHSLRQDAFCPNCYFIWDILRRTNKVFKDEESETKPESKDKATGKTVKFVDTSTSAIIKPAIKPMSSNLTLCDFLSDCSSGSMSTTHSERKSDHHERVSFLEDFPHVDAQKVRPTITNTLHGNCFCLENFMDSIRPPLKIV